MNDIFLRFPGFRNKALTLSYDDGAVWDKKLVEIMDRHGLKGTFNLNSGRIAAEAGKGGFTGEEILSLYGPGGHEIAVHGVRHLSLAEVDPAIAADDVLSDRKAWEKLTGHPVRGMAYANGSYNDKVAEILRNCGIVYSRTTVSTERFDLPEDWLRLPATCHHNNPRLMELAKAFLETPEPSYYWARHPRLFYLWGHSFEFNNNGNWNVIEEFAAYMSGHDGVWYATNMEIYEYVQAYRNLVFGANDDFVCNPGAVDVYIDHYGKQYVIPAGKQVNFS